MNRFAIIINFMAVAMFSSVLSSSAAEVVMDGFKFVPEKIEIKKGESVKWFNKASLMHTVTGGEDCAQNDEWGSGYLFPEKMKPEKSTYEKKFDKPGTYKYFCKPHCDNEKMVGEVVVKP